jgi:transposase
MWPEENQGRYDRDLTAEEWGLEEPLIPHAKRGGGKRRVDMREVVNGIMYILSPGCQWRYCPKTCRRRALFSGISIFGTMTAPFRSFRSTDCEYVWRKVARSWETTDMML